MVLSKVGEGAVFMASFLFLKIMLQLSHARVVKLVDTHALGACAARLASSSLVAGTRDKISTLQK